MTSDKRTDSFSLLYCVSGRGHGVGNCRRESEVLGVFFNRISVTADCSCSSASSRRTGSGNVGLIT